MKGALINCLAHVLGYHMCMIDLLVANRPVANIPCKFKTRTSSTKDSNSTEMRGEQELDRDETIILS
jgi:hypothetical protein